MKETKKNTINVFVYGTLKAGFYNNKHYMKEETTKFVGNGTIDDYMLVDTHGYFPYMVANYDTTVVGEVYEIDNFLDTIDMTKMEINAGYDLVCVNVDVNGENIPCLAYAYELHEGEKVTKEYDGEMWLGGNIVEEEELDEEEKDTTTTESYYERMYGDYDEYGIIDEELDE